MTSASKFLFALGLGIAQIVAQQSQASKAAEVDPAVAGWIENLRADLRAECKQLENALAADADRASRADLLAMYGRSAWASGEFGQSAAAYAMFISEFGTEHTYSRQILARLAASLAPLDLSSVDISHTKEGPEYRPTWRAGKAASKERLRFAASTYEILATTTKSADEAGKALVSLGWVQRALGNWDASTAAWDRAADVAKGIPAGADALWHAADNLAWTNQPAAAAERLRRLATEHQDDARVRVIGDRIELLEAESRRTAKWFDDPVASLQKEIAERAAQRKPHEVYASAVQWLQGQQKTSAIIAVSRWATTQTDWPLESRLNAHLDLADALLRQRDGGDSAKREAADALGQVASLASNDDWSIPAAIRRSRLLSELHEFDAADKTLAEIESRWKANPQWGPSVLIERMQSRIEQGDIAGAKSLYGDFQKAYPNYELSAELFAKLTAAGNGGGR